MGLDKDPLRIASRDPALRERVLSRLEDLKRNLAQMQNEIQQTERRLRDRADFQYTAGSYMERLITDHMYLKLMRSGKTPAEVALRELTLAGERGLTRAEQTLRGL